MLSTKSYLFEFATVTLVSPENSDKQLHVQLQFFN